MVINNILWKKSGGRSWQICQAMVTCMFFSNCLITSLLGKKILMNLQQKTSGNFQIAMKRISEVKAKQFWMFRYFIPETVFSAKWLKEEEDMEKCWCFYACVLSCTLVTDSTTWIEMCAMITWWMKLALLVHPQLKNLWLLPYNPNTDSDPSEILAVRVSLAHGEQQELRSLRKVIFMWNANNSHKHQPVLKMLPCRR